MNTMEYGILIIVTIIKADSGCNLQYFGSTKEGLSFQELEGYTTVVKLWTT